jgi:hypothetical protein
MNVKFTVYSFYQNIKFENFRSFIPRGTIFMPTVEQECDKKWLMIAFKNKRCAS